MEVVFPDGTRVIASSVLDGDERLSGRDFGLYLDPSWNPTWPAEIIDWPDFELPRDGAHAAAQIYAAFSRAKDGQGVEIGCIGGLGRTGTVLACMAVLAGVDLEPRCRLGARALSDRAPSRHRNKSDGVDWFAAREQ